MKSNLTIKLLHKKHLLQVILYVIFIPTKIIKNIQVFKGLSQIENI